jgi:hypothetical protein
MRTDSGGGGDWLAGLWRPYADDQQVAHFGLEPFLDGLDRALAQERSRL